MKNLQPFLIPLLANPITKQSMEPEAFTIKNGYLDARVFLKHTYGYSEWAEGQDEYENVFTSKWEGLDTTTVSGYLDEIERDRPVYDRFALSGRILDCGGGAGTLREFLPKDAEFVSVDPWIHAPNSSSIARKQAYKCLNEHLNFIACTAEFLPFVSNAFDWVHMRSMLDHVQVADLAIIEAYRVLRPNGKLLIGLYLEGGKTGRISPIRWLKNSLKAQLELVGINRWKDFHVWHPTYAELIQLVTDNGFEIEDTYWQPGWNDKVCYLCAVKRL